MARLGTMPSEDQCRLRYDTLLKAYKTSKNYCLKAGMPFSEISEEERRELKLAKTLMREEWYKAIDAICGQRPHKVEPQKRLKLSRSDDNGLLSMSPCTAAPLSPPPPTPATSLVPAAAPVPAAISEPARIPTGSSKLENSPQRQVAIPGFCALDEDLRSTLLNLIQASFEKDWLATSICKNLEMLCKWLAIVQDREASDIRSFVFKLSELKLVNIEFVNDEEVPYLELSNLRVYRKFVEKVLHKNPVLTSTCKSATVMILFLSPSRHFRCHCSELQC